MMDDYKIIVEQEHSTVMAHYDIPKKDVEGYQSEAMLEAAFIKQLQGQGADVVVEEDFQQMLTAYLTSFDMCDVSGEIEKMKREELN